MEYNTLYFKRTYWKLARSNDLRLLQSVSTPSQYITRPLKARLYKTINR